MDIRHEDFIKIEEHTQELFRKAGWQVELIADFERIEGIVERAHYETIIRSLL